MPQPIETKYCKNKQPNDDYCGRSYIDRGGIHKFENLSIRNNKYVDKHRGDESNRKYE